VIIVADVKGAAGVHLDRNGQPFALVEYGQGWWSLTASHETLEMLADPWGNRLIAGNSPKPDQGRVEFWSRWLTRPRRRSSGTRSTASCCPIS